MSTTFTASVQSLPDEIAAGPSNELLVRSGVVAMGEPGAQFYAPSFEKVVMFDDFLGDVIADQWGLLEGTDSGQTNAAILAGGIGGVLQITTGDAGTGLAADMAQIVQALQWQASNGNLVMEARLKLSAITTCYVFIGFTDLAATLEAPIESAASANTLTSNASDAVGFMFDTRMTDDNWWLVGVKANTDATHQDTDLAPVADTYATFRVEVSATGEATFYYNGAQVGTAMANAITAATDLTPTINVSKTSVAASMTADVDYVYVSMDR
jgi:hypothetical protein